MGIQLNYSDLLNKYVIEKIKEIYRSDDYLKDYISTLEFLPKDEKEKK